MHCYKNRSRLQLTTSTGYTLAQLMFNCKKSLSNIQFYYKMLKVLYQQWHHSAFRYCNICSSI